MRVLIVKLSSLGDVVHALPVVHDIRSAFPGASIDWVVEPAFAPLLRRVHGLERVIECPLRRWTRAWWTRVVRSEVRGFLGSLRSRHYDAVLDLQGLTKSALIARFARGASYGLANRTEGAGFEAPARWMVDHAMRIEPRIHALDRARELAARALGYRVEGPPDFGLRAARSGIGDSLDGCSAAGASGAFDPRGALAGNDASDASDAAAAAPTLVFIHGSSRADKLWPEASWIELGRRAIAAGWRIALPHAGAAELARAQRIAAALNEQAVVWPALPLDALLDRMARVQGAIGVDSGPSHIAVALNLPHVQLYNFPTAWRTGPQPGHGHRHQVAVEGRPAPSLQVVWNAWLEVSRRCSP